MSASIDEQLLEVHHQFDLLLYLQKIDVQVVLNMKQENLQHQMPKQVQL